LAYQEAIIMCYGCQMKVLKLTRSFQYVDLGNCLNNLWCTFSCCVVCIGYCQMLCFCNQIVYTKLIKKKLELQAKVNATKEMDMCMKVKQLSANMWGQVVINMRPFLDFMDFFKPTKVHNMVAFMLDPW